MCNNLAYEGMAHEEYKEKQEEERAQKREKA
jgi:hypothetical protein